MESLLAKALESKLKYWLKSYTREQFKLKGRTVELCNLDLNGEVLHASIGLPPTLLVSQARVGKLELTVPAFSNVQVEPVVVEIDKLDIVLEEKSGPETETTQTPPGAPATARSSSYGFADKIADGMTLKVGTVNLLLETRGGKTDHKGASWTPPLAALTIRKLILYTTNEAWQVVNLKEAREFSTNKKCIYVFKFLEWESLSIDLLPHPDMFNDEKLTSSKPKTDDDGAKRLFFGGERFLDNISGKAYITMHRTEQNNPLGLEVQVHVPEAVCSALSEPGLRALLRFMTGMYVCMNRGDVDARSTQSTAETAGRSLVSVAVDHIFLCIKDADFQLELLLHSLKYARSTVITGDLTKTMARIDIGGVFLRDTFSQPSTTLVQPGLHDTPKELLPTPSFASEKLWPRIYPLGDETSADSTVPLICMYSVQTVPSPNPPVLASQTVIQCQPLRVELHEESCLRLASFLVDGIVVEHGVVTPTTSVDSLHFSLKQLDLAIPMKDNDFVNLSDDNEFTGACLCLDEFVFVKSPSLTLKTLDLERDAACFMLWPGQPVDASQRKWVMRAMHMTVALETKNCNTMSDLKKAGRPRSLWRCIEMTEPCVEAAMVTGDGEPILTIPPPQGIVRFGLHCKNLESNTSVEQLFFVLKMYEYLGKVNKSLMKVTNSSKQNTNKNNALAKVSSTKSLGSFNSVLEMAPSDTAVNLGVGQIELKFLESVHDYTQMEGQSLVQVSGSGIHLKVAHRTLGGAIAISSKLNWHDVLVECVETNSSGCSEPGNGKVLNTKIPMRPVFWISNGKYEINSDGGKHGVGPHFLDIDVTNVIPYRPEDAECHSLRVLAKISGIRLGGGMVYSEALLHRFGVFGPDGGPGKELKRVLHNLSNGPLAGFLKPHSQVIDEEQSSVDKDGEFELGIPDEIDVCIQLKDWVFSLEADPAAIENALLRTEQCWHSAFQMLSISAQGSGADINKRSQGSTSKSPVQSITVGVDGLEFIKPSQPQLQNESSSNGEAFSSKNQATRGGLDVEVLFGLKEDEESSDTHMGLWSVKSVRSGIKKPVQVEATKEEVEYLIDTVKLEIESASRIAAGFMQLLKLQGSLGQAAIQQLSSIGSGSLERMLTPEKMGRRSSIGSVGSSPLCNGNNTQQQDFSLYSNLTKVEQSVLNSREICLNLSAKLKSGNVINNDELLNELSVLTSQLSSMEDTLVKSRNALLL